MANDNFYECKNMLEDLLKKMNESESASSGSSSYGNNGQNNQGNWSGENNGMFSSMFNSFKGWDSKQFFIGALMGAAATYVMTDAEARDKILKFAAKIYSNVTGGFEEFKEQMADIKAEMGDKGNSN